MGEPEAKLVNVNPSCLVGPILLFTIVACILLRVSRPFSDLALDFSFDFLSEVSSISSDFQ